MKNKLLVLILLIIGSLGYSQSKSIYGPMPEISQSDIDMTEYEKDKDAGAVVLYDYGVSYFSPSSGGFEIVFERTLRIKILKESGIDYSEIIIPFYTENRYGEEIEKLRGVTYNFQDGSQSTTELDKDQTYIEIINDYLSILKVPMPNVQVGSIIELKYRTVTKSRYHLHDWEFQWDIPVIHSEYQVSLIPFYIYKWILQGANKFDSRKSQKHTGLEKSIHGVNYKEMTHNYVMKDVPAFKDADFITTRDDYIIKMDWQLIKYIDLTGVETEIMSSWDKIRKEYNKEDSFGKFITKSQNKAKKLLNGADYNNKNDREKAEFILNYVKGNYNWNGMNSRFAFESVNKFISNKEGLSGEINLFTVGLLRAVGIEAYGILSSTRKHGRIYYDYPFTHFFNYILIYAKIDGEFILLDATDPYLSNYSIPSKSINGKGLLIHDGDVEWVPIKSTTHSEKKFDFKIKMDDEEVLTQTEITYTGYYASNKRDDILEESYNLAENLMEGEGVVEESVEILNIDNAEVPLVIKFDHIKESPLDHDKIYFSPFQGNTLSENPLKEKSRKYPLDFTYSKKYTFKSTIKIPEGFEVDYTKKDYSPVDNDYFQISYNSKIEDENVIIEFSYWSKKASYPSTSYGRLKHYFKEIVQLGQEKVVFKKKE